jgi:predicted transcriptional regulator
MRSCRGPQIRGSLGLLFSCAIGLTSTSKLTEAEIARQIGVSEQSVRRAMNKFTKLANLDPARGLFRSNGSALKENGQRRL